MVVFSVLVGVILYGLFDRNVPHSNLSSYFIHFLYGAFKIENIPSLIDRIGVAFLEDTTRYFWTEEYIELFTLKVEAGFRVQTHTDGSENERELCGLPTQN